MNKISYIALILIAVPLWSRAQNRAGCTRGVPEPIINKNALPDASFKLSPDSLTAVEQVTFERSNRMTITHQGCEYEVKLIRYKFYSEG